MSRRKVWSSQSAVCHPINVMVSWVCLRSDLRWLFSWKPVSRGCALSGWRTRRFRFSPCWETVPFQLSVSRKMSGLKVVRFVSQATDFENSPFLSWNRQPDRATTEINQLRLFIWHRYHHETVRRINPAAICMS